MTTFVLKAADLTPDGFLDLVATLEPPTTRASARRVWMEAADGWTLDWWSGPDRNIDWCGVGREPVEVRARACLARTTAGRLFASDGELRWRVVPALGESCWRTVFLGGADWVGAGLVDHSEGLNGLCPSRNHFFLWGRQTEHTPGEWIELRIPHRFRYPVDGGGGRVRSNVQVEVEQWRDEVGELHFFRLCDLVPAEERSDA